MARRHADALRGMRAIYIDSGKRDEYFLDLGAEAFRRELEALGITDVFFELFDARARQHRVPLPARDPVPRRTPAVVVSRPSRPPDRGA